MVKRHFSLALLVVLQSLALDMTPAALANNAKKIQNIPKESFDHNSSSRLTKIGPLHMYDGIVMFRGSEIYVLSDEMDPASEAELSGAIINRASIEDMQGSKTTGIALFLSGMSLPALDDGHSPEVLTLNDGTSVDGRIKWINAGALGIQHNRNLKIVQLRDIASVNSPRAFSFAITKNPEVLPENAVRNNITFQTTSSAPPSEFLATDGNNLKVRLEKHKIASKVAVTAATVAAVGACFAIPIVIGAVTPKLNNNSSSSSSSGSSSSSSSSSGGSN